MPVEGLAVALRADKHRAQARFVEEGLGRRVRSARRLSPRVQRGSLVSLCDETEPLGSVGSQTLPWQLKSQLLSVVFPPPAAQVLALR